MLEWLKEILGDSYTEEIDKKVSAEIGKAFVAKGDFDAKNTEAKSLKNQLTEANKTIEGFKAMDMDGVRREAQEWKAKAEQAEKYIPLLDEVYKNDSLTAKLDGAPELAQQGANANEMIIPKRLTARPGGALVKQKQTLKRNICHKPRPVLN